MILIVGVEGERGKGDCDCCKRRMAIVWVYDCFACTFMINGLTESEAESLTGRRE